MIYFLPMQLDLFDYRPADIEEWRPVVGFPGYSCSSLGRFRNDHSRKILGGNTSHNGYRHIGLLKNGRQITKLAHRLIAETFLTKPSPSHNDCNHKNKLRTDNRVCNLEWLTRRQNSLHARNLPYQEKVWDFTSV